MASIDVDTAALHAAGSAIGGVADRFATVAEPAVAVSSAQATGAAVKGVNAAVGAAESTMVARLRSTATAMSSGATSFAATERASTEAVTALAPSEQ